jgi:hypothetical protein
VNLSIQWNLLSIKGWVHIRNLNYELMFSQFGCLSSYLYCHYQHGGHISDYPVNSDGENWFYL